MTETRDQYWMQYALDLAQALFNTTTPNPRVGCVIVRDDQLLGQGATQPPGGPHAEICALQDAALRGASVIGATVYVTLEPCSHYGRTPPCVEALIAARPSHVVVAMGDPNPLVQGKGLAKLRAAGIRVTTGLYLEKALALNAGYVARITRGTPWAWLKMAVSLDGRSALTNGVSQWMTGPAARADGHAWRARADVVLTGIGTVRADDPQLTVRELSVLRQPRKAVVDGRLQISENARVLNGEEVWIFTAENDAAKIDRLARHNARVMVLPAPVPGCVDLTAMMQWLGSQHINEVHIEAGARLNGALLRAGCVDEMLVYMAPLLLGDAMGMVQGPPLAHLHEAPRFTFIDVQHMGEDLRLRGRFEACWQTIKSAANSVV